ncbi:MAG: hypothetical protein ACTSSG_14535, partial [Candidatus Heimdallarchaeaceae archaeon]
STSLLVFLWLVMNRVEQGKGIVEYESLLFFENKVNMFNAHISLLPSKCIVWVYSDSFRFIFFNSIFLL